MHVIENNTNIGGAMDRTKDDELYSKMHALDIEQAKLQEQQSQTYHILLEIKEDVKVLTRGTSFTKGAVIALGALSGILSYFINIQITNYENWNTTQDTQINAATDDIHQNKNEIIRIQDEINSMREVKTKLLDLLTIKSHG